MDFSTIELYCSAPQTYQGLRSLPSSLVAKLCSSDLVTVNQQMISKVRNIDLGF